MTVIGVLADPANGDVVREFFELFKTPWEFHRSGGRYDVLLCTDGLGLRGASAKLLLVYAGARTPFDDDTGVRVSSQQTSAAVSYGGCRIPIYGKRVTFRHEGIGLTAHEPPAESAAYSVRANGETVVRVGYDLFAEIRALLSTGQPAVNASIPTLELHITLLRQLITGHGISVVEIPPVPDGHRLIACLTHDVDHASIRRHGWDHTTFGFLYRACVGSLARACRGRGSLRDVLANWAAALTLPLVHMGLAKDFWSEFPRYLDIDPPAGSTFFVIPVKDYPGRTAAGHAPGIRASRYAARDIADTVQRLVSAGCEVGVHGIDAWLDSARASEELKEVARITGAPETGIRMHWLYGDDKSPEVLEKAGFLYDSTSGYNETVGYRAGTTQVFKPLQATRLLELPLHVMDTALFYGSHLDLSPPEACQRIRTIVDNAVHLGGAVTVNWHDRSIAPERLWAKPYAQMVDHLTRADAWFATASRAVAWFRQRRSAVFESLTWAPGVLRARVSFEQADGLPGLRLRIHSARAQHQSEHLGRTNVLGGTAREKYVDVAVNDRIDTCVGI